MSQPERGASRSERTRSRILAEAEGLFALRGFAATRLEEVAEAVGIRRASIVYYFRDKRALYDAVLDEVFGDLHRSIAASLTGDGPIVQRIEDAVNAWVDFIGARPAFARLLLREVADATPDAVPALRRRTGPFVELVEREVFRRAGGTGPLRHSGLDPVHVASAVAGSTVFLVAAMPALFPGGGADHSGPESLAVHREQVLRLVRALLRRGDAPGPPGSDRAVT